MNNHSNEATRRQPATQEIKDKILQLLAEGSRSQQSIAEEFGITQGMVSRIKVTEAKKNGAEGSCPVSVTGIQAFHHKAIGSLEDARSWRSVEKHSSSEAINMAIDVAELASSAWKDAATHLRRVANEKK